jgi:hypothetical protein
VAARSPEYGRSGALNLTDGGAIERGEHGELGLGLTGARVAAWQSGDAAARRGHGKLGGWGSGAREEKRRAR